MKSFLKPFILLLVILSYFHAFSQNTNIKFNHITTKDGLSHSYVDCIVQDTKGFIWFGTEDGLNRFDGYELKSYFHDPSDSNSLSDNFIRSLYADSHGYIWVGTESHGLNVFDPKTESITRYINNPGDSTSLIGNTVYSIFEDSRGTVWIGTRKGLERVVFKDEKKRMIERFHHCRHNEEHEDNSVYHMGEDKEGNLWICCSNQGGLQKFIFEEDGITPREIKRYRNDSNNPQSISSDWVMSITEDKKGILWIGTWAGGLNRFDPVKGSFDHFKPDDSNPSSINSENVYWIVEDEKGAIWFGTYGGGLNRITPESKYSNSPEFQNFTHNPDNSYSISNNRIRSVMIDQSGLLWLGTLGNGVDYMNPNSQFLHYSADSKNENGLSHPLVNTFFEDSEGDLWIGTQGGGINRMKAEDRYKPNPVFLRYDALKTRDEILTCKNIKSITEDKNKNIWFSTPKNGLFCLQYQEKNKDNPRFIRYFNSSEEKINLPSNELTFIFNDSKGQLWLGTDHDGVFIFSPEDPETPYRKIEGIDPFSRSIYEDPYQTIWVASRWGGVHSYELSSQKITHYSTNEGINKSLSHYHIFSFFRQDSITMWFGTEKGLDRLNMKEGEFTNFREKDGLANDFVYSIIGHKNKESAKTILWISTYHGISMFDTENNKFRNYYRENGLQSNIFREGAALITKSDWIYMGGNNGYNRFFPDSMNKNDYIPPVELIELKILNQNVLVNEKINGNIILKQAINYTDNLKLSYKENIFSIKFSALDYHDPSNNRYAYKMEGFDDDWIYTDANKRTGYYSNLPSGTYSFQVKGANSDGTWNNKGKELQIVITPPFWNTWWFRGIILLILIIGIIILYKMKEKTHLRQKMELENKINERTEKLQKANVELKKFAHMFQEKSNVLAGSSEEFSEYNRQISSQMSSIASAMEEMSITINEVAGYSEKTKISADDSTHKIQEGGKELSEVVIDNQNIIKDLIRFTEKDITDLEQKNRQISDIVEVINDIADQTNLLALNAAIEAARAGDAGKGFAVVADEVRKLAEKTAGSTNEISKTVKTIRISSKQVLTGMNEKVNDLVQNSEKINRIEEKIKESNRDIDNISEGITNVATATQQQSQAAEEISLNIHKVHKSIEDSTHLVDQLTQMAEELKDVSGKINNLLK